VSHKRKTTLSLAVPILAVTLAACSSTPSTPSQPKNSGNSGNSGQFSALNACESDFKSLAVAVEAYTAAPTNPNNAAPVPPAPWSAATYKSNFAPLMSKQNGGPYMSAPLDPTRYVIEYDGSGHVWVEPAGQYDTTYNPARGSDKACAAVVK
jgi:hypothetical protein